MDAKTKVNTKRTLILSDYQASPSCIATKATKSKIELDPAELTYNKLGHLELQAGQMIQEYQVTGTLLGEGTFGRVWEVLNIQKNKKFALKLERRSDDASQSVKKNLLSTEILNLRRIKKLDPSGLKSFCAKLYKDIVFNGHSCLVFDVLGQSVYDFMNETNEGRPYLIEDIRLIASQLFNAVKFLHSKGIVHTDLKPENILFVRRDFYETKSNHGDKIFRRIKNRNIRLIDFGGAHFGKVSKVFPANLQIQTALYRAVECLLGLEWSAQVDIWSIGCILYELYKGKALFYYGEKDTDYEHNSLEHLAMINTILGEIPEEMFVGGQALHLRTQIISEQFTNQKFQLYYSNKCKKLCEHIDKEDLRDYNVEQLFDLMQQCFVFTYKERITPSQAIQHQFLQHLPSLESYVKAEGKEEEEAEEDEKVNELEDLMQNITLDKVDEEEPTYGKSSSRDDEATRLTEGQRIRAAIERNSRANKYFRMIPIPTIPKMNKSLIPRQAHKRGDSIEARSKLIREAIKILRNHEDKNSNQESFIKYKVGDLVMVECEPYPYWPAIVQIYPAAKPAKWKYEFTCLDEDDQNRQFYLQYLGPLISRAWTDQTKIICHYTGWYDFCTQIGRKLLNICKINDFDNDAKRMMKQIVDDCTPSEEESDIEGMTIKDVWLVSMAEAVEACTMTNEKRIRAFTYEYVDEYTNQWDTNRPTSTAK